MSQLVVSHLPGHAPERLRRIRDLLRSEIVAGGRPDGVLPSEENLRAEFSAPRAAVRGALGLLQAEGLVTRVRGQGTFITNRYVMKSLRDMHGVHSPVEDGLWDGRMRAELVDWREVPATPPVARMLEIEPGSATLRIDYVAFVDRFPIGGATNYVVYPEAGRLRPEMFRDDFYALLRRAGIGLTESVFRIDVGLSDEHDRTLFGVEVGAPMTIMEMVYFVGNRPVDAAFARSCGTQSTFFV